MKRMGSEPETPKFWDTKIEDVTTHFPLTKEDVERGFAALGIDPARSATEERE